MNERYYQKYAAAAVIGSLKRQGKAELLGDLTEKALDELDDSDFEKILDTAKNEEIKIYHFKRSDRMLPRVHKVLGFLKGIYFESLLDVGSGRGVFLLPFLEEFPFVPVTSVDILEKRISLLSDIRDGGVDTLSVIDADICTAPVPDKSHDVVTLLEVLEHIPDVRAAIRSAVRIAREYIVVTVPSKEDDNPEHIHLLTRAKLTEYFGECGVHRLTFDAVPGHLFMIARLGG